MPIGFRLEVKIFLATISLTMMVCCGLLDDQRTGSPQPQDDISDLIHQLNSHDFESREEATKSLSELRPPPISELLRKLLDGETENEVRSRCFSILQSWSTSDESVIRRSMQRAVKELRPDEHPHAQTMLVQLRETLFYEDETRGLITELQIADGREQLEIIWRLSEIGLEARDAAPVLIEMLDRDEHIDQVAKVLSLMGPEILPELRNALEHENREVRIWTLYAIGYMGSDSEPLVRDVILLTQDPDDGVRKLAIETLGETAIASDDCIACLTDLFADEDSFVVAYAVSALREMGPKASSALPELALLARDHEEPYVRCRSLSAIDYIDRTSETLLPALIAALHDKESDRHGGPAQSLALSILTHRPSVADDAGPDLLRMLSDEGIRRSHRSYAEVAGLLGHIGSRDAIPTLKRDVLQPGFDGPKISGLPDPINPSEHYYETCMQVTAARALAQIEPSNTDAIDILLRVLKEEEWNELESQGSQFGLPMNPRVEAAVGLGLLGDHARHALPVLRSLINESEDPSTRLLCKAAWAIARIDREDTECLSVLKPANMGDVLPRADVFYLESPQEVAEILGKRIGILKPALIDAFARDDNSARLFALNILAHAEPSTLPQLAERLAKVVDGSDWKWNHPPFGLFSGSKRGVNAVRLLEHLIPILDSRDPLIKQLTEMLESPNDITRAEAVRLLGAIGEQPATVVPRLVDLLDDPRALVRGRAAQALGQFGKDASSALPALQMATNDQYNFVRQAAEQARVSIDTD